MRMLAVEPPRQGPFCLMLGNFDGVHKGHQAIIQQAKAVAAANAMATAVLSFQPHPLKLLAPQKAPRLLQTPSQKRRLLAHYGVDAYYSVGFDEAMSRMAPEAFVKFLCSGIAFKYLLVGFNFRFGYQRSGDLDMLRRLGETNGFTLQTVTAISDEVGVISSSRIRNLVASGDLSGAAALYGRPYVLEGEVLRGRQLGRQLAAPTANICVNNEQLPKFGVYASWVRLKNGAWYRGITNIGKAPTVAQNALRVETHIFGFEGDLYGQRLQLYFGAYLREEQKFSDLDALRKQIHHDFDQRLALADRQHPDFALPF